MAASLDYTRLRDQTLGSTQDEEAVTVNTRALIDKVLARYSGEWTTLRELIQNAADASASKVTIKFETLASSSVPTPQSTDPAEQIKHVVLNHTVQRLVVSNNGQAFNDNDWNRLKRIAEGNPDETKIGAFGVGFYSVFADCESPFVISGKETMAFYWKGNSLFTRKGKIPDDKGRDETCFILDYRNTTSSIPSLISLCQFLSTSLTFVGIENIELWLDEWNVFSLTKKSSPSETITIPKEVETKTKDGMMRITGVERQNSQIDASWKNIVGWTPSRATGWTSFSDADMKAASGASLRSFFSKLTGSSQTNAATKKAAREEEQAQIAISEDLMGTSRATVFIRVNTVQIKSQVASGFAAELERATKKPPPKTTKIAILTSSYDETSASLSTLTGTASKKAAEIITSILPSKNGRIFIGFPTAQTTGLLAHISAPSLIPTVERESIDLNARYVKTWNTELLNVAGIACRIAYAGEMSVLRSRFPAKQQSKDNSSEDTLSALLPAATHTLKQYTFQESTPLAKAGQIIEEAFWTCSRKPSIDIFSSRGVLPSHEVRIASEDLSFVSGIPVIPETVMKEAKPFINKLLEFGLLSEITMSDIRKELEKQALSENQLIEFLKWAAKKMKTGACDASAVQAMFAVTVVNIDSQSEGSKNTTQLLLLGDVKTFINSSKIPPELPVPPHTIPFRFTKSIYHGEMQNFGWDELQIVPWLRWLVDGAGPKAISADYDFTSSPAFSEKVLQVVSRGWDGLSQSSKTTITELLVARTVIPTKLGMRKPPDAYFASVKLFDDLPTITSINGVKEKFLKALGVRKTIELSVIFERLMAKSSGKENESGASWSHVDLVRYLTNVWSDIPAADITQLEKTALCPAEKDGDPSQSTSRNFKVSELFEPKDSLRALGLPIVQWPSPWNTYASEAKFLKLLGLRPYPSLPELLEIMVSAHKKQNTKLYEYSIKYFIENHYQNGYGSMDLGDIQLAFLPLEGDSKALAAPSECFTDTKAAMLQFRVLRQDLQQHASKFGVRENPPIADCASRIIAKPPQSRHEARKLFGYFAGRGAEIFPAVAQRLGSSPIVPIPISGNTGDEKATQMRMVAPVSCFLGDGEEYGEIFDYVDFGEEPNLFLLKVGSKHEPNVTEVAQLLLRDYTRILQVLGTEKYQALLRKLHLSMATLKRDKLLWKQMKTVPFLLAYKEKIQTSNGSKSAENEDHDLLDDEPDSTIREYRLRKAETIVIVDDVVLHNLFRQHLAVAPQEEILEDLYHNLGTPRISSLVDEESRLGPRKGDQKDAERLRELILERARLFLHDQNPGTISHDAKWLEKNLEVQTVQSITIRITLRGQNLSHTEHRSATMTPSSNKKALLSITSSFDWWQISTAIVGCVIDRPKPQATMLFETFLTTPLLKLRARGYNVDRILRKKAAEEARIAETERQRRKEEEKKRLEEEQQQRVKQLEQERQNDPPSPTPIPTNEKAQSPKLHMPGSFSDSPDPSNKAPTTLAPNLQSQKPKGIFRTISKHFGFDSDEQENWGRGLQNSLENVAANTNGNLNRELSIPTPNNPREPQGPQGGQVEKVTAPGQVQQNLQSAINASRAYGSDNLFSMPQTNQIKEVESYCDTRPGHNMTFLGTSRVGLRTYISNDIQNGGAFIAQNAQGLDAFSAVLLAGGRVFGIPLETVHLYYDEAGNTLAFNQGGSLFFNYRFFAQLHQANMNNLQGKAEAIVYWWVVMCHELAHNLVGDHSSNHSYYTEQFIAQYFPFVAGTIGSMMSGQS